MPPRLAASAWAGLRLVGFLADFTAALVGLVAVHLDHLLQTRKGQRRLRWDLRGGTNPPNPQCAATYLMVAVPIVRRVLQQVRCPILQLGLIVLEMEEVVPPFCKTTWAVWAASRESWPRPDQPPPPSSSHDPPPLHPRPLCSATGSDKQRPVRWLYPLRHSARCP